MRNEFRWTALTALMVLLICLALVRTGWAKIIDQVEVVVDQDEMTQSELDEAVQAYFAAQHLNTPDPNSNDYQQARQEVIKGFVQEVLLAEQADSMKIDVSDDDVDHAVDQQVENIKKNYPDEQSFEDDLKGEGLTLDDLKQEFHDQLTRRIKAERVLHAKEESIPTDTVVTDDEAQAYYSQHPDEFAKAKFAIILFRIPDDKAQDKAYIQEVEKQAQGVLKDLKAGADFATAAKKYSEDSNTADKGGEVGMVSRGDLDPTLAQGVFAIPEKGLGLVKSSDGIYIVKMGYKGQSDYASVAADIKDEIQKEKEQNAVNAWVDTLKKKAYVVVDGKVVDDNTLLSAAATPVVTATATPFAPVTGTTVMPSVVAAAPSQAADQATAQAATDAGPVTSLYPTLPPNDSWTLYFDGLGLSYGSQDLADQFGPSVDTDQGFPFGVGLDAGMEWALDPTILIGGKISYLRKITENVTDPNSNHWQLDSGAFGPALSVRALIPLDESTNFTLSLSGGYYLLSGAGVTISNTSNSSQNESFDESASNFGADAGAAMEFFLDDDKTTSLELGGGYRFLQFTPVTTKIKTANNNNNPPTVDSPLVDNDGSQADIDFSGVWLNLGIRLYLDKGD